MKLILQDVRCFAGRHTIPLHPLTLLVGENSTGKSTLLAIVAAVASATFPDTPGFNEPPFDLGTFDTIATRRRRGQDRSTSFAIGFVGENGSPTEVVATYTSRLDRPVLTKYSLMAAEARVLLTITHRTVAGTLEYAAVAKQGSPVRVTVEGVLPPGVQLGPAGLWAALSARSGHELPASAQSTNLLTVFQHLYPIWLRAEEAWGQVEPLAPIRSKPKRIYDAISEEFRPEGEHVPVRLARVLQSKDPVDNRQLLASALGQFGDESGLFSAVNIKRLGDQPTSPFQILVSADGRRTNLTDVGYGVSQSLPVVAESILESPGATLLLQQPEVHLHPRAQAALGSFFARLVGGGAKRLLIETHSDQLVDRVRYAVSRGVVKPADVGILFFENRRGTTRIHTITVDSAGNILGAPPAYRRFFLDEARRLLTRQ